MYNSKKISYGMLIVNSLIFNAVPIPTIIIIIRTVTFYFKELVILMYASVLFMQDMEKSLKIYKDDPNEVDKTGFGFGPIHYLIKKNHANRKELLICLAIYSMANLDLTTTELREVTALHLACQV